MGPQESQVLTQEDLEKLEQDTSFTEEEILNLHRKFQALDTDGNGAISLDEFMVIPELAINPLLKRVIATFGVNKDNEVEFGNLLKSLNIFSVKDRKQKLKFCFDIYDIDGDGVISNGELFTVLKTMCGKNLNDVQLQQVVDKTILEADSTGNGNVNFDDFCKILNKDVEKYMGFDIKKEASGKKKTKLKKKK